MKFMNPPLRTAALLFVAIAAGAALIAVARNAHMSSAEPACRAYRFEGSRFLACAFDPENHELRLQRVDARGRPLRRLQRLREIMGSSAKRVRFAMNAGMFDANSAPIGLYVEDYVERRPLNTKDGAGNFYMKPNGVFWVARDGTVHVEPADAFEPRPGSVRWATQSGPMLVMHGALHPQIQPDGPSRNIRNGVGVRGDQALFVLSEDPVSFGRLARFFSDTLGCRDALYLDGAVSSLWWPGSARVDNAYDLGPMIIVSARP